jgi:cystathionine beta-lyase/cystathionine gamma-synthase
VNTYWEESVKEYFNNDRDRYLHKLKEKLLIFNEVSSNLIMLLIDIDRIINFARDGDLS